MCFCSVSKQSVHITWPMSFHGLWLLFILMKGCSRGTDDVSTFHKYLMGEKAKLFFSFHMNPFFIDAQIWHFSHVDHFFFKVRYGDELRTNKHAIEQIVIEKGGPDYIAAVITWWMKFNSRAFVPSNRKSKVLSGFHSWSFRVTARGTHSLLRLFFNAYLNLVVLLTESFQSFFNLFQAQAVSLLESVMTFQLWQKSASTWAFPILLTMPMEFR